MKQEEKKQGKYAAQQYVKQRHVSESAEDKLKQSKFRYLNE
jgi:hypothetical protein